MKGRKPKPTALHALHGDPSHLRKNEMRGRAAVEPPRDAGLLQPPWDFTDVQKEVWEDAVASAPAGILRRIDTSALTAWVIACDLHRQARTQLAKTALLVKPTTDPKSTALPVQSPYLAIINRQAVIMLRAAAELGFTPTSRPRLYNAAVPPPVLDARAERGGRSTPSLDDYLANRPAVPRLN